jgi:hypothetical protein
VHGLQHGSNLLREIKKPVHLLLLASRRQPFSKSIFLMCHLLLLYSGNLLK